MKKNIDILLDDDGDLMLDESGEPVVGDVTIQNMQMLMDTNKGDLKLNPLIGVGIEDFIDDEGSDNLLREVRKQLKGDGFKISSIKVVNDKISIDASYI